MVENIVPGGMHPGQERNMDLEWFALMKYVADTIANELKELRRKSWKDIWVYAITGNHDRWTPEWTLDTDRRFVLIVYELIKEKLRNFKNIHIITQANNIQGNQYYQTVDLLHDPKLGINYHHGDNRFNEKAAKEPISLLWRNYAWDKDNIILSGHWHQIDRSQRDLYDNLNFTQKADNNIYKRKKVKEKKAYNNVQESIDEAERYGIKIIRVPSISPLGSHAQSNGYRGDPGFVHIKRSPYGWLDISTRNLGSSREQTEAVKKQIKQIQADLYLNVEDYRPFHG